MAKFHFGGECGEGTLGGKGGYLDTKNNFTAHLVPTALYRCREQHWFCLMWNLLLSEND